MRGVHIFEKPCYREIRVMRGRAMRGLPVVALISMFQYFINTLHLEFPFHNISEVAGALQMVIEGNLINLSPLSPYRKEILLEVDMD